MIDFYASLVREFHLKFEHPVETEPTTQSGNEKLQVLRTDLLLEEVKELEVALAEDNIVEVLDALADIQYVLSGAVLVFGLQDCFMSAVEEVHRSNMSKLGEDAQPIYDDKGKVQKGPNYSEPDLGEVLESYYKNGQWKVEV